MTLKQYEPFWKEFSEEYLYRDPEGWVANKDLILLFNYYLKGVSIVQVSSKTLGHIISKSGLSKGKYAGDRGYYQISINKYGKDILEKLKEDSFQNNPENARQKTSPSRVVSNQQDMANNEGNVHEMANIWQENAQHMDHESQSNGLQVIPQSPKDDQSIIENDTALTRDNQNVSDPYYKGFTESRKIDPMERLIQFFKKIEKPDIKLFPSLYETTSQRYRNVGMINGPIKNPEHLFNLLGEKPGFYRFDAEIEGHIETFYFEIIKPSVNDVPEPLQIKLEVLGQTQTNYFNKTNELFKKFKNLGEKVNQSNSKFTKLEKSFVELNGNILSFRVMRDEVHNKIESVFKQCKQIESDNDSDRKRIGKLEKEIQDLSSKLSSLEKRFDSFNDMASIHHEELKKLIAPSKQAIESIVNEHLEKVLTKIFIERMTQGN